MDPTKISNKQTSYKGVLDLPNRYILREAIYLAKQAVGNLRIQNLHMEGLQPKVCKWI